MNCSRCKQPIEFKNDKPLMITINSYNKSMGAYHKKLCIDCAFKTNRLAVCQYCKLLYSSNELTCIRCHNGG